MRKRELLVRAAGVAGACLVGPVVLTACGGTSDSQTMPPSQGALAALTLNDTLNGLAAGQFTSEALVTACLAHASNFASYNAFTWMNADAVAHARESDARRRRGDTLGALEGVPIAIKESMDYVGAPSTMGWHLLSERTGHPLMPIKNAEIVQSMIDAGAIVIGKTNMPAFSDDGTRANSSWAGPTYNAIDRALAPGASSSGTATAVAAGFAVVGLGEETGGSIQNPAAAQSLVGLKPSFGLISTQGVAPLAHSTRDVVGPIAKTVQDAAIMMDIMVFGSGSSARPHSSGLSATSLRGKRLGLYGAGWKNLPMSAATEALYRTACEELKGRGAVLLDDPFANSGFADLALPGDYDFSGTESVAYDMNNYVKGLGLASLDDLVRLTGLSPFADGAPLNWYVQALPELASSLADPSIQPALTTFQALKQRYVTLFNQVMDSLNLDALVFPHAADHLPALDSADVLAETTVSAINIAGIPGLTVPAGRYADNNAPFSLIFVGRAMSEPALLSLAYDYEQATRHRIMPALEAKP